MCESTNLSKGTLFHITKFTEDFFHWDYLSVSISLKVLQIVHAQIIIFFLARYKNPSVCTFYIL